jgi:hypothetical protein
MRFNLRLFGKTIEGRECILDASVYARGLKDLEDQTHKLASEGPWYFKGTSTTVPEQQTITVEHVEQLKY